MKKSTTNRTPEDSHSGDAMGGSYAREKSSGVFDFGKGGLRRKPDIDLLGKGEFIKAR